MAQSWDEILEEHDRECWQTNWIKENPSITRAQLIGLEVEKELILRHLHSIKWAISRDEGDTSKTCIALNNLANEIKSLNFMLWPDLFPLDAPQT